MRELPVEIEVNGTRHALEVAAGSFLIDVLRERLGLRGAQEACDEGECGTCTVLVDGQAVDSCVYFAAQADGRCVRTVEGLAVDGELHPLQRAFAARGAVQCGFCTPGFLMAAVELLDTEPDPDEATIRESLAGNLCRCTGYDNIVAAVRAAAAELREQRPRP